MPPGRRGHRVGPVSNAGVSLSGRSSSVSRSIATQTLDELGGPRSVLARQRADHVQLDRLLQQLAATSGVEQEEVLQRIDRLVFSHAFAEETVLWPVLRRVLPDGDDLTLRVEE